MEEVIRFAVLGFGVGALYSLASQGLIVIYRGSGVLNFALGAMGMIGAFATFELHNEQEIAFIPALIAGVLVAALLGALTQVLIMRPLRTASSLVRVIATLGVLITLQSIAVLRYGTRPEFVPSELPTDVWNITDEITVSADRFILLGIAVALTVGLWAMYRYTRFGLATTAVAENERAASSLGLSPDRIAVGNWALGAGLAGLAAILIAPIVTLQVTVMTDLILAATAAALVASFRSFPIALAAGLAIGIAQTELDRYVDQPGVGAAVPFIVIVLWLVLRGQALPLRDYFLQRLPSVGSGRISWPGVLAGVAVSVLLLAILPVLWTDAITITFAVAIVLLSIVVVTGYAGQLSLAQFALAGFGAWVAGRLVAAEGLPFWVALPIGVAATLPLGILFALPAVRTRGINLAIVTLGLGTAIELMLFDNPDYTGGIEGTQIGDPTIFGWSVSSITHPTRYGIVVLAFLVLCSLAVANVRRGRSGRRLIAVRTNERAAAALGISVPGAKLYAFGLSSLLAAVGGILFAFRFETINYQIFDSFTSVTFVGLALIGGLGYVMGPVLGATLAAGALGQQILDSLFDGVGKYIGLISGVSILALLLLNQDGVVRAQLDQFAWVRDKLGARMPRLGRKPPAPVVLPEIGEIHEKSRVLTVTDATVKYGAVTAVNSLSLEVQPGRIMGLIGPNGAGKTTLIDAVTGFTPVTAGTIELDGEPIDGWSAARRARGGLGRSFQSLELFEDSTVLDNLRVASDPHDFGAYITDVFYPRAEPLPGEVVRAIKDFGLEEDLRKQVEDLPYGKRRLLAIARAVATHPSVLLLDEPVAGLGDKETAGLVHLVRTLAAEWGMGVLLVEHDMSFVMPVCDEIVVMDFGAKIAEGIPEIIRKDPKVIAAYLGDDTPAPEASDERLETAGTDELNDPEAGSR